MSAANGGTPTQDIAIPGPAQAICAYYGPAYWSVGPIPGSALNHPLVSIPNDLSGKRSPSVIGRAVLRDATQGPFFASDVPAHAHAGMMHYSLEHCNIPSPGDGVPARAQVLLTNSYGQPILVTYTMGLGRERCCMHLFCCMPCAPPVACCLLEGSCALLPPRMRRPGHLIHHHCREPVLYVSGLRSRCCELRVGPVL